MKNLKIIKTIKKIRKKKYQFVRISAEESKKIKRLKEEIYNTYKNVKKNKLQQNLLGNKDSTLDHLKRIYNKEKLNLKEKKFIEKMYYKYNSNLNLKARYNKDFSSLTKKNTSIVSYIYLGLIIKPNKKFNLLQILNMILKICDQIIINLKNIKTDSDKILISKLLYKEMNYLKKIKNK